LEKRAQKFPLENPEKVGRQKNKKKEQIDNVNGYQ
jgi:hypothetical protein